MTDLTLTIPDELYERAKHIAESTSQPIEQVILQHLQTLPAPLPILPDDVQAELDALKYLSDDALWTIAREQMPDAVQSRAHDLMNRNSQGTLSEAERSELDALVDRADRLMVRKAEAAALLRERGYPFTQQDYKPHEVTYIT
jgi:hypothetical protein